MPDRFRVTNKFKTMKNFKVISFFLAILVASCSPSHEMDSQVDEMLNNYLNSSSFYDLGIEKSNLDLVSFQKGMTQSQRISFSISLKSRSNQFIIGVVKSSGDFGSFIVTVEKDVYTDDKVIFNEGRFYANYTFYNQKSTFGMKIENSIVTEFRDDPKQSSLRCNGIIDVLDCAARHIDSMRTIARLSCYATIGTCLAIEMADCILDGCANL